MDPEQRVSGRWAFLAFALTFLLALLTWRLVDDQGYEFNRAEFSDWVWCLLAIFGLGAGAGVAMLRRRSTRARGAGVVLGVVGAIAATIVALAAYLLSHGS